METLRRIFAQLQNVSQGMSPGQRWMVIVAPLLVLGGIGGLVVATRQSSQDFLLGGKAFSPEEISRMQEAFQSAGLTGSQLDGARISVPRNEVDRYTAVAAARNSLPAEFSSDFDRMQSKINLFTSNEQRKEMLEEARKMRLSKILRAIPEIEEAVVEWERLRPTGLFRPKSTLAAQVSVRGRASQPLPADLVRSLKLFVAGALAGSTAEDITVVDMVSGKVYGPQTSSDAEYDRVLSLTRQYSVEVQNRVSQALQYIPDVLVTANVELDKTAYKVQQEHTIDPKPFTLESNTQNRTLVSSQRPPRAEPGAVSNTPRALNSRNANERSDQIEEVSESTKQAASYKNIETQTAGLTPTSVQVAISIPEDYFKMVAIERGATAGTTDDEKKQFQASLVTIRQEVLQDVKAQVARLIPENASPNAITVNAYTSVKQPSVQRVAPLTETISELVTQWSGLAGLILFAGWAVWMVSRSTPKMPELPQLAPYNPGSGDTGDGQVDAQGQPKPKLIVTKKDEVQGLVRDNPELAAAVLSRWIIPVK